MDPFGLPAVGDLLEDVVGPLFGNQPGAGEGDTHVADRVGKEVRRPRFQVYRYVFQRLFRIWVLVRAADGFEGDGVFFLVQAEGHRVEIILGPVDAVVEGGFLPVFGDLDRLLQGLKQHDVIVHRVNAFFGVWIQLELLGQFTVGQLQHDRQGALAVERRTNGDQGGVLDLAVQCLCPGHA